MAEDDLLSAVLSGVAGGLEGYNRVAIPRSQARYEDELLRGRQAQENERDYIAKTRYATTVEQPFELEKQKALFQQQSALESSRDYISGADILTGRPDLADSVDPARMYNKALLPYLKPGIGGEKAKTKLRAQEGVTTTLGQIGKLYKNLQKTGAIVSTESGKLQNVGASIRSSRIGQFFGSAIGTKPQSIRNQINQIKPLLIQEIRKATEMGARGLDSEKELQFYLRAATDETKDVESNLNALKVLDRAYGLGNLDVGALTSDIGLPTSGNGAIEVTESASGMQPDRKARLEELRRKRAEGALR